MRRRTLAEAFHPRPRENSLNALRLLLAALVIVSHSWAIGGYGPEPELGGATLGTWAVIGFFGLSGFLITRSRLSGQPARSYYWARVLRILPAFLVCLVLIAAVFAPLSTLLDHSRYSLPSAVTYVLRNLLLYPPAVAQDGIAETLTGVPYPATWDGSLWTLFWEATCYVLLGVGVTLLPRRRVRIVVAALFAAAVLVGVVTVARVVALPGIGDRALLLLLAFAAGSLLFLFADTVRLSPVWLGGAAAVLLLSVLVGQVQSIGAAPFVLLLLWLGCSPRLGAIGAKYDVSYGIYIYAWPVQQLAVLAFGRGGLPLPAYIALCLAGTWVLAAVSCLLVEQPALRLKSSRARTSRVPV